MSHILLAPGMALAMTVSFFGCAPSRHSRTGTEAPTDVILITIDALRGDSVGYACSIPERSPNLDAAAEEGVVFQQAIASSSGTTASMASMMTGLYPNFEGITAWKPSTWYGFYDLASEEERQQRGLTSNVIMLAEMFKRGGYRTVGFHTNPNLSKFNNFHQGFDEYYQFEPYLNRIKEERSHRMIGHYPPAPITLSAVGRWLRADSDSTPLFLWIHLMDPHSPYLPEPENTTPDGSPPVLSDLEINDVIYHLLFTQQGNIEHAKNYPSPEDLGQDADTVVARARELYDLEISYMDRYLGGLIAQFKESGRWAPSTVMITADHGEEFHDHGFVTHHFKSAMAEELIHVPLVIKPRQGAVFTPGTVIDSVVRMVDFAPTLADYAGLDDLPPMDGESLRPLIEGDQSGQRTAYLSTIDWGIVRDGHWKYRLEKATGPRSEQRERLFDIIADPMEEHDLSADFPDVLETMRSLYQDFSKHLQQRSTASENSSPDETRDPISQEDKDRLEALGYVQD